MTAIRSKANMAQFKPLRTEKFSGEIANQIKESIFNGTYNPGDRLPSESEFARMFGGSNVTVRQAMPTEKKDKILSAIFGSKAGVDLLRFSLKQGISKNIYQKDLVKSLNYSNKTIIENLKTLNKLGVLTENMEKNEKEGRIIWVKLTS